MVGNLEDMPSPDALTAPLTLSYTWCPTVAEYLAMQVIPGDVFHCRLGEARLSTALQNVLVEFPDTLNLLAVLADGLPDLPGVLPLWIRLAEACPRAELRMAGEAQLPLLERLLGDDPTLSLDTLELPQLLVFDDEWHLIAHWGPRPQAAEPFLDDWLTQHPEYELLSEAAAAELSGDPIEPLNPDVLRAAKGKSVQDAFTALNQQLMLQMRLWYNSGLDTECSAELHALFAALREESDAG